MILKVFDRQVICLLLSAGLICFWTGSSAADESQHSSKHQSILTVTGHGEIHARPDTASIRLGVESQAKTATLAQGAVNDSMQRVLKKINTLGVTDNEIQTAGLNLVPIYAPQKPGQESEPPHVIAYRASNMLQVRVHDLKLTGPIIDAGLKDGANRLEGVAFELSDDVRARTDALKEAAKEARTHAQALADALNVNLEKVAKITESGINTSPPHPVPLLAMKSVSVAATPVEPGEINVQASVSVEYVITPKGTS